MIASNQVPDPENEDRGFKSEVWNPVLKRTLFVEMPREMPEQKGEEHYSVNQLAHAL